MNRKAFLRIRSPGKEEKISKRNEGKEKARAGGKCDVRKKVTPRSGAAGKDGLRENSKGKVRIAGFPDENDLDGNILNSSSSTITPSSPSAVSSDSTLMEDKEDTNDSSLELSHDLKNQSDALSPPNHMNRLPVFLKHKPRHDKKQVLKNVPQNAEDVTREDIGEMMRSELKTILRVINIQILCGFILIIFLLKLSL